MSGTIAISIKGDQGREAPIDPRFGRAEAFLVVHLDTGREEILPNPHIRASHGAGPATSALLGSKGVTEVISGHYGPKAARSLDALGIVMWTAPEGLTAGEVLERHAAGTLDGPEYPR